MVQAVSKAHLEDRVCVVVHGVVLDLAVLAHPWGRRLAVQAVEERLRHQQALRQPA